MVVELHRNHIARLHVQDVPQLELTTSNRGAQWHRDVQHVLLEGVDPAFVLVVQIGLEPGIEHFADRLDHRVRHGHVQVTAAAIEFDVEGGHHDRFAGADDVGHGRIHFRVDVLEGDFHDCLPGFFEVDEGLIQHDSHHAQFRRREFTAFDLGVTPVAAEEVIHQLEYQLGIQDEQRSAAQRLDLHQVQAGRHVQRVHVLAELHHLHTAHRHVRRATQQVEHADTGITGETLVDHFQGRHTSADDAVLAGQVITFDAARFHNAFGLHQTIVHAMQQRVDFILGQQVLHGHVVVLLQYVISEKQLFDHAFAQFLLPDFLHHGSGFLAQHFHAHRSGNGVERLTGEHHYQIVANDRHVHFQCFEVSVIACQQSNADLHVTLTAIDVVINDKGRRQRFENRLFLYVRSLSRQRRIRLVLGLVHDEPGCADRQTYGQQQAHHHHNDDLELAFLCGVFNCVVALRHANNPSLSKGFCVA